MAQRYSKTKTKLIDLDDLDEATLAELNELVPMYEELVSTAKVHLLQSIVSRILVEMVFDAYFAGLTDEQARHFKQMEKLLLSSCSFSRIILPTHVTNNSSQPPPTKPSINGAPPRSAFSAATHPPSQHQRQTSPPASSRARHVFSTLSAPRPRPKRGTLASAY